MWPVSTSPTRRSSAAGRINAASNGGTITPPTGTVAFTIDGTQETGTFVGDSGDSAIYTYTYTTSSAATSNSVSASTAETVITRPAFRKR